MNAPDLNSQLLAIFPFFRELPIDQLDEVLRQCPMRMHPAGSVLFTHGTRCSYIPLLLSGVMRVSKVDAKGRELPLYRVRAGELCAVMTSCSLKGQRSIASGIAEQDVTVLAMPRDLFSRLMAEQRSFANFVFDLFVAHMAGLMRVVEDVAFLRLDQRLATLLLDLGNPARATHQQLADELGSVREIVSRVLRGFEERHWVVLKRGEIELIDVPAMRLFVSQPERSAELH